MMLNQQGRFPANIAGRRSTPSTLSLCQLRHAERTKDKKILNSELR